MKAIVNVKLKQGVLDPQGKAIMQALNSLGYNNIDDVRVGKQIVLNMNESDKEKAKDDLKKMCEDLLANTVIEEYEIVI